MQFNGWFALSRSTFDFTYTGKLSNLEQLVYIYLLGLAGAATGSGHINAPALCTFLPDLSYPAAKRILLSLETKGLIYREIVHKSTRLYRYWCHGYQISRGNHSMFWTDLTEVIKNKDTSKVIYAKDVPEAIPEPLLEPLLETVPETLLEGVPNNNNDKEMETYKETDKTTKGPSNKILKNAVVDFRTGIPETPGTGQPVAPELLTTGLRFSEDAGFTDASTGARVAPDDANRSIAHLGLMHSRGKFHNAKTGRQVSTQDAIRRITGAALEERRAA